MNRDSLLAYLPAFETCEGSSDGHLVACLSSLGMSSLDAQKLCAFAPVAFGRVVLAQLGVTRVSSEFMASSTTGKWVAFRLNDQVTYTISLQLAMEGPSGPVARHLFEAIAKRSSELGAASKAIKDGHSVKGSRLSPVFVMGISAEEFGYKGGLLERLTSFLRK
jgi:hypothetical protein